MRAILLASATATSILGLRASIRASHDPGGAPRRTAQRTTLIAPVINNRLTSRWPIFDILPSRGLPPVECCRGTRPSQAEKSRPRRKLSIGGAKAWIADAQTGPTPGMLISRLASSSSYALVRSRLSNSCIFSFRPAICASRTTPSSRTASGNPEPGLATADANRATWESMLLMWARSLTPVAPCSLPPALGCRRLWRLGYRRTTWTAGAGLGAATVVGSLVAGLLGPIAIAAWALVISLPAWIAGWWLARRA